MNHLNYPTVHIFLMYIFHYILLYTYLCILLTFQINCDTINQSNLKELHYFINEESEIGSYIGNLKLDSEKKFFITSNDQDSHVGGLNTPTFELYDDTNKNLFRIEETSGKLFVASRIDRETICQQPDIMSDGLDRITSSNDPLSASSLSSSSFSSRSSSSSSTEECQVHLTVCISRVHWINVIITIHDINDHTPYFPITPLANTCEIENLTYIVNVSESVSSGYEIPLILAKDPDEGINSVQSYSLRGSEFDDTSLFSLSYRPPYSLNLIILGELDAEVKNLYTGELIACDGGQIMPKCCNQPFQLHVTDVNDNKPTFNQSVYDIEIPEDLSINSTVIQLTATDKDSSQNGQLLYKFGRPFSQTSQEHFSIDKNTGEIILKAVLNAKENAIFLLPVLAYDSGSVPLVGQTMVRITVKDTNDHAPWIEIRPNYGIHEANLQKSQVNNSQVKPNSNSTEVKLSLNENQPTGTNIGLIISGDEDIGDNSMVTCALKMNNNNNDFILEHANSAKGREIYRLSTNKSFDRETVPNGIVAIIIVCKDNGKPSRTTEQKISLTIIDVNEFRPEFPKSKRFIEHTMPEDEPLETVVLKVQATDADATPEIQYHMSREAQSYFHIDPDTGIIKTRAVLDRETMPQIRFLVYAADNYSSEPIQDNPAAIANVTVHLTDKNDNSPELIGTKTFQIVENRPGFSDLVGQLTSIDQDVGNNGTVRYKLLSISNSKNNKISNELFMVNSESGKLFATKKLDREENSHYDLTILLYDLGTPVQRSSTATIVINVMDENDNSPQWGNVLQISSRSESQEQTDLFKRPHIIGLGKVTDLGVMNLTAPIYRGQQILILIAKDPDDSHNANLTFHLIHVQRLTGDYSVGRDKLQYDSKMHPLNSYPSVNSPYFAVVSKTGELIAGPGLKGVGLTESGTYELYVRVSDNGNPPMDSNARLFLQVHESLNSVYGDKFGEKGFLGYILANGHLGTMLIVILLLIMCLTSICLIIAFISIRRRSSQRQRQQQQQRLSSSNRKASKSSRNAFPLQLNDELIMKENMNLDGTIGNYGKLYHSPILNAICIGDGESLYKWNPECGYTVGNFGPPPIYNFCALNTTTLDRMRSSRTDSDKSSSALISTEFPCPPNHFTEERTVDNEDLTMPYAFKSPLRNIPKTDPIGNNTNVVNNCTEKCFIHTTNQSELNEQLRMNVTVSEIDGGSADSGQGASEEEPVNQELSKLRSKYARPYNSKELLLNKTQCSPIPSSNDCLIDSPSRNKGNYYPIAESNPGTQTALPSMNTFTNQRPSLTKPFTIAFHNVSSIDSQRQSSSPITADSFQPRWRKPLFSNTDLGHQNHLFDEFPLRKVSVDNKHSSTLPLGVKVSMINHHPKYSDDMETNFRHDGMLTNSHVIMKQ
uniref:Cadherin n=1 Tax=Trichobilharzia regenti TaxID=157069 RepID=A0AA85JZ58_TRIRE|nr:unnamed protein product [Trichobilharzia regenti]